MWKYFNRGLAPGLICFFAILALPSAAHTFTAEEETNISIYQQRSKGVVNITTSVLSYDVFLNPVPKTGAGSGVILDKKGYIATNHHVIEGAKQLEVTLYDGSKWKAKLVGTDPDNDLAVISIEAPPEKLNPIPLGDSANLVVGQKVLAIGNPFGLQGTLTIGIVSSLGRSLKTDSGRTIDGIIQTDASINPGNSGGPLLSTSGELVGINSAIFTPSGGSVGIGFAIPASSVKNVTQQLVDKGYVSHPYLGVQLQDLIPEYDDVLKLGIKKGAIVTFVTKDSPAQKAGIAGGNAKLMIGNMSVIVGGDILVEIDGQPVNDSQRAMKIISEKKPGEKIALRLFRDKAYRNIAVALAERPH